MRPSLLPLLACLAALAVALAGPAVRAESGGLTVTVASDGTIRAAGTVPSGFSLRELGRRVAGIDLAGVAQGGVEGGDEAMQHALDGLTVILPRLAKGEVRVGDGRFAAMGRLRPGFSAERTRAAVRLALGAAWETALELAEAPPAARLTLTWSRHGAVVGGILPEGLTPEEALSLLSDPATGGEAGRGLKNGGLTGGGGGGDAAAWRHALALAGRLVPAYRHAALKLAPGRFSVDGALMPGHEAERLRHWLAAELGEGWEVALTGAERPASEGATRADPVTGRRQKLVRGHWLSLYGFTPTPAACGLESRAILARAGLVFVPGKARLEPGAAETLDRLAGLARHCLNAGGLGLEIGGHTDSRGAAEENLALSERRAMVVLRELVLRGVRADAMRAVGHGEARAIAGNDTPEGRARNRRITFRWSGSPPQ